MSEFLKWVSEDAPVFVFVAFVMLVIFLATSLLVLAISLLVNGYALAAFGALVGPPALVVYLAYINRERPE
jgi:uncharacterized membrane protein